MLRTQSFRIFPGVRLPRSFGGSINRMVCHNRRDERAPRRLVLLKVGKSRLDNISNVFSKRAHQDLPFVKVSFSNSGMSRVLIRTVPGSSITQERYLARHELDPRSVFAERFEPSLLVEVVHQNYTHFAE
jgi:hypothetical protein